MTADEMIELERLQARLRHKIRRTDLESGGGMVSADGGKSQFWSHGEVWQRTNPDGPAAADAIDGLLAELKVARQALEPFAREARRLGLVECQDRFSFANTGLSNADLRRARTALTAGAHHDR